MNLPPDEFEFIDIYDAASILNLHRTQASSALGKPDKIVNSENNRKKYLYRRCRVEEIKRQRDCEKCIKDGTKGKKSCYHCRNRVSRCELTSGICAECQARKFIKNFTCHGDCCSFPVDCERISILSRIIAEYQLKEFERENAASGI